jgi:hypothetical protein
MGKSENQVGFSCSGMPAYTGMRVQENKMPIDYERMKRTHPKLKAMLTRATHVQDDAARSTAVIKACTRAVQEWELIGAWPDNWSAWQRALDDFAIVRGHGSFGYSRVELSSL